MKKLNITAKIFLYLAFLSGVLWTGSYMLRMFLTFRLFEETGFVLKQYLTTQNLPIVLTTLYPTFITTFVLYIIFIVTFMLFLVFCKMSLKQNGWLFIITLLLLITFPFETYLMTIDYKIITALSGNFDPKYIISLIVERFKVFNSFPIIEIISYFTMIYLAVFQPLTSSKKLKNEN